MVIVDKPSNEMGFSKSTQLINDKGEKFPYVKVVTKVVSSNKIRVHYRIDDNKEKVITHIFS